MDNWKKMQINHPKKGLIMIKDLSSKQKGRAIFDLSTQVAKILKENADIKIYINQMGAEYANYRASIDASIDWSKVV